MATSADSLSEAQLLDVKGLKVHFPVKEGVFSRAKKFCKAVDGVDLRIRPGETYGLVGESGCGKSTLGKAICRLLKPTQGEIRFLGQEIESLSRAAMRPLRRDMQIVFQDPAESLNSRHTVREIIEEPLSFRKSVTSHLETQRSKSCSTRLVWRRKRRIGIHSNSLRSTSAYRNRESHCPRPKLIICDEPVSALDVSVQPILNLLMDLQKEMVCSSFHSP